MDFFVVFLCLRLKVDIVPPFFFNETLFVQFRLILNPYHVANCFCHSPMIRWASFMSIVLILECISKPFQPLKN